MDAGGESEACSEKATRAGVTMGGVGVKEEVEGSAKEAWIDRAMGAADADGGRALVEGSSPAGSFGSAGLLAGELGSKMGVDPTEAMGAAGGSVFVGPSVDTGKAEGLELGAGVEVGGASTWPGVSATGGSCTLCSPPTHFLAAKTG